MSTSIFIYIYVWLYHYTTLLPPIRPSDVQVVTERIRHIEYEPEKPEPFYKPSWSLSLRPDSLWIGHGCFTVGYHRWWSYLWSYPLHYPLHSLGSLYFIVFCYWYCVLSQCPEMRMIILHLNYNVIYFNINEHIWFL